MTKNPICSKYFPEIIDFSRNFKESRTNLNVSKQLKKPSNTKENQVLLRFSRKKLFEKSWIFLAFPEKANSLGNFWCSVC